MVGGGDYEALGARLVEEDEEGTEDAPGLADVVTGALGTESIELIKEVDRPLIADGVEKKSKLAAGFAEELAEHAV